jgi:hypothetical protein
MQLAKLKTEQESPGNPGLSSLTTETPMDGIFCPQTMVQNNLFDI